MDSAGHFIQFSVKRLSRYTRDCDRHSVALVDCECHVCVCCRHFHGACGLALHNYHVHGGLKQSLDVLDQISVRVV